MIEGEVGKSFTGDIALDDLRTTVGDCPPNGFCDFENIFCSWNNIRSKGAMYLFDECAERFERLRI